MRVLGIDPGTLRMGYGVVSNNSQFRAEDYGVIVSPRDDAPGNNVFTSSTPTS